MIKPSRPRAGCEAPQRPPSQISRQRFFPRQRFASPPADHNDDDDNNDDDRDDNEDDDEENHDDDDKNDLLSDLSKVETL